MYLSSTGYYIYIEEHRSKPRHKYFPTSYAGHVFEKLCTSSTPLDLDGKQITQLESDDDPDIYWLSVISRKLGDLNIVVAGEVDCINVHILASQIRFLN